MQVHLERQAGIEVADLRAADEQRVARLRALSGHHQHVARVLAEVALAASTAVTPGSGTRWNEPLSSTTLPRALRRERRVREAARDRDGRLRVLALAQVVPDRVALVRAERVLEPVEHLGGLHLARRRPGRTAGS